MKQPQAETDSGSIRKLLIVFGDQLSIDAAQLAHLDKQQDAILMMEVDDEATYIPQHKIRLVLFFSAMRHFREALKKKGYRVFYTELEDGENTHSFAGEIKRFVQNYKPEQVLAAEPGDYRVMNSLQVVMNSLEVPLDIVPDQHFLCSRHDFQRFAEGQKSLLLESFYRQMRRRYGVLMQGDEPEGGHWNYDKDNRESFGNNETLKVPKVKSFAPDNLTRKVMDLVERRYPDSPGQLDFFDYPVTREQALEALQDFIEHRLSEFGRYQDAMVTGQPYLYHSRLTCVLNLHLLDPREAIDAAVEAYYAGKAPLNSVEGFVRQILGWREYVRGVYWLKMPEYEHQNALNANLEMPGFMWTANTDMRCLQDCLQQLVDHAYAHHIQRLMVLGLFSLLLGVNPWKVHEWHMSMYADAVDWVSVPNVLGMSQYADGGFLATKPYAASGNYIQKMSNYCRQCRYNPKQAVGEKACPITTLYWDFLDRNKETIGHNHRMKFQYANLVRKSDEELLAIREQADSLRKRFA
ncbi:cryptochrome/photolyase family protein [Hahella ganghwensis]|uniref:cryptochrome/photolyase family protein n=1 Tax=Hahella ganghwensis TaxID=286420 RepID=UPI00036853FC|nr:cryptochrome/photolyase family protein [Hahella ganghwensis]